MDRGLAEHEKSSEEEQKNVCLVRIAQERGVFLPVRCLCCDCIYVSQVTCLQTSVARVRCRAPIHILTLHDDHVDVNRARNSEAHRSVVAQAPKSQIHRSIIADPTQSMNLQRPPLPNRYTSTPTPHLPTKFAANEQVLTRLRASASNKGQPSHSRKPNPVSLFAPVQTPATGIRNRQRPHLSPQSIYQESAQSHYAQLAL